MSTQRFSPEFEEKRFGRLLDAVFGCRSAGHRRVAWTQHEPTWQLLGQCRGRILLQQPEEGAHPGRAIWRGRIVLTTLKSVPKPLNGRRREAPVCHKVKVPLRSSTSV